jgi:AraC-like DNA-binding protein
MDSVPKNLCEIHSLGPATHEWLVGTRQVPAFHLTHTRVAGYSDARHGYEFVRHSPVFSQVLACTGGEGEVLVDGGWQRCPAGFAYVTAPRALCAYRVRPRGRWQVCWVLYEEIMRLPALEAGQAPRLVRVDATGLHLAIEGLCYEAGDEADPATLEFWATLVHRQAMRMLQPGGGEPRLSQLWSAAHRDLGGVWDLKRMAKCAGMSQESLRRLCLRQVGRPPLSHLTRLRMNTAADMLCHTQEKVASVAARVGYADAFAFSTAFKREMGMSPSRYRSRQNRSA